MHKKALVIVVIGALLVVASFLMDGLGIKEPPSPRLPEGLEGVVIESPPTPLPEFDFYNHHGEAFTKAAFKDKWSLFFFGYTNCPDFCPTSMMVMNKVSRAENLPETQFVFGSVDPKRDTAEVLKEFVTFYNPNFIGVSGDNEELDKFVEPLGNVYDYEGDTNEDDYIVNHFGAIYILDPSARLRAYILPPHDTQRVLQTYLLVRNFYED